MARPKLLKLSPQEEQALKDGFALQSLTASEGWPVLLSYLKTLGENIWFDPTEKTFDEDFKVRYTSAWASRKFAAELVGWVDGMTQGAEVLDKKRRNKEDPDGFSIN